MTFKCSRTCFTQEYHYEKEYHLNTLNVTETVDKLTLCYWVDKSPCLSGQLKKGLTKEGDVWGRVAYELDERFPERPARRGVWRQDVGDGVDGEERSDAADLQTLQYLL